MSEKCHPGRRHPRAGHGGSCPRRRHPTARRRHGGQPDRPPGGGERPKPPPAPRTCPSPRPPPAGTYSSGSPACHRRTTGPDGSKPPSATWHRTARPDRGGGPLPLQAFKGRRSARWRASSRWRPPPKPSRTPAQPCSAKRPAATSSWPATGPRRFQRAAPRLHQPPGASCAPPARSPSSDRNRQVPEAPVPGAPIGGTNGPFAAVHPALAPIRSVPALWCQRPRRFT
jgi:hypothetical protein